jgi:hypothetical protein
MDFSGCLQHHSCTNQDDVRRGLVRVACTILIGFDMTDWSSPRKLDKVVIRIDDVTISSDIRPASRSAKTLLV